MNGLADVPLTPRDKLLAALEMKVLSATHKRPRDLGDLQAMLRTNPAIDESRVASLLRAIEARGYSRGQDLAEKWRRLRSELGG
jgi:hypothetical protein